MKPNAVSFGCATCKGEVGVKHLVFHEGQLHLVGYCKSCRGEQVVFRLDHMIARLMGKVLAPAVQSKQ